MIYDFSHGSDFEFIFKYYLKEVRKHMFEVLNTLSVLLSFAELYKFSLTIWRHLHECSQIAASIAVVRSRPYSCQNVIWEPKLIALLD